MEEVWFRMEWFHGYGLARGGHLRLHDMKRLAEGAIAAAYGAVCPALEVRRLTEPWHPCVKGRGAGEAPVGVFAADFVGRYAVLGAYTGTVRVDSRRGSGGAAKDFYEINLPPAGRRRLYVDAAAEGNQMGCINDYRGIRSKPNALYCGVWVNGWPRVLVVAVEPLAPGDEVLADYGDDWWHAFQTLQRASPPRSRPSPPRPSPPRTRRSDASPPRTLRAEAAAALEGGGGSPGAAGLRRREAPRPREQRPEEPAEPARPEGRRDEDEDEDEE